MNTGEVRSYCEVAEGGMELIDPHKEAALNNSLSLFGIVVTLVIGITAQAQSPPMHSAHAIELKETSDIEDASKVHDAVSVLVKDGTSCHEKTNKEAEECACGFKEDLRKLKFSYDAAAAKHPSWNRQNTFVSNVDHNGRTIALSLANVGRQLDSCASRSKNEAFRPLRA